MNIADPSDADIDGKNWEDRVIADAKNGDGSLLALLLADGAELAIKPASAKMRQFFAAVFTGKVKLKRPKKLTFVSRGARTWRERLVLHTVRVEMGNSRNKNERRRRTEKYSKLFGTTPEEVARYAKHSKPRR